MYIIDNWLVFILISTKNSKGKENMKTKNEFAAENSIECPFINVFFDIIVKNAFATAPNRTK